MRFFTDYHELKLFWTPRQQPEGSYKIGSAHLSFCPSVHLSGRFLWIVSLTFSKFWHGARNPYEVVLDRAGFSRKIYFLPKMDQKQGFLNLLENFVLNFFWIWSIKKFYNICCILAQIPYLGKFWFLRYGPKCSRPIRLHYF